MDRRIERRASTCLERPCAALATARKYDGQPPGAERYLGALPPQIFPSKSLFDPRARKISMLRAAILRISTFKHRVAKQDLKALNAYVK